LHSANWRTAAAETIKIVAALLFAPLYFGAFCLVPHKRLYAELKLYRAFGKLAAVAGHRCYEYAKTHGS
jgi:hypothetical protein